MVRVTSVSVGWGSVSPSSRSELSGEAVRERDAAGVASTPDDALVANGGGA